MNIIVHKLKECFIPNGGRCRDGLPRVAGASPPCPTRVWRRAFDSAPLTARCGAWRSVRRALPPRAGGTFRSSGMWCLRMWCLIIQIMIIIIILIDATFSLTMIVCMSTEFTMNYISSMYILLSSNAASSNTTCLSSRHMLVPGQPPRRRRAWHLGTGFNGYLASWVLDLA